MTTRYRACSQLMVPVMSKVVSDCDRLSRQRSISDGLGQREVVIAVDFPGPTLFDGNATKRLYINSGASQGD